jgi:hypothetical protein
METMAKQAMYFHPTVRVNVAVSLPFFVLSAHAASPPAGGAGEDGWTKGVPTPLAAPTAAISDVAFKQLMEIMEQDEEKEVGGGGGRGGVVVLLLMWWWWSCRQTHCPLVTNSS